MKTTYLVLICSLAIFSHQSGASAALQTCQKTSSKSIKDCGDARDGAKVKSEAAVADAQSSIAENKAANNTAAQQSGASTATTAAGTEAKGTCTDSLKKCDDDCAASKGEPKEKPDIAKLKKKCDDDIGAIIKALEADGAATTDSTKKSEDTKKESQGGGMQMPQMPKSDDDKKSDTGSTTAAVASTATAAAAVAPTAAAASTATGFSGSCADSAKDASGNCPADTSTTTACPAGTSLTTCSLSVSLCGQANHDQCPSCRKFKGQDALPTNQVTQDCSLDPAGSSAIGTNPLTSSATTSAAGGGSSSGGGGSSGLGTASGAGGSSKTGASPESAETATGKLLSAMGTQSVSGGGGGGSGGGGSGGDGSSGGSNDVKDFLSGYNIIGRSPANAKTKPGITLELNPRVTDVAPSAMPAAVFQINSMVIKARCDADKELNCPPRN